MRIDFQHLLKTAILALFSIYFIRLHSSGDILKYINPEYDYISLIAAILLTVLFIVQLFRIFQRKKHHHYNCVAGCHHNHHHGHGQLTVTRLLSYGIILFPILTGFIFEPATLNAAIAANKGSFYSQVEGNIDKSNEKPSIFEEAESLTDKENIDIYTDEFTPLVNNNFLSDEEFEEKLKMLDSSTIQMKDDMFTSYYEAISNNPSNYIGRTIKMTGFVYKEPSFSQNQLVVSRFMIVHCIADAVILGFLTEFDDANKLDEDTWIEIEGVLDTTNYDGVAMPIIKVVNWNKINEPIEPYVYPVLSLIQ